MENEVIMCLCCGYHCGLAEKCKRYELFRKWEDMEQFMSVPFTEGGYDAENNHCDKFVKR